MASSRPPSSRPPSSRPLRALITNDDGIDSPGLWVLAAAAVHAGLDVVVAAPHVDASGVSASVQAVRENGHTRVHRREIDGLPGVPAYAVEGHPAFIVHSAHRGWLDPAPDLVLSGINLGANVGRAVLHSGTVGAALTASLHGRRGLAVSLDTGPVPPEHPHWQTVSHVLPAVLERLLASPAETVFSLNVPDRPPADLGELRAATLTDGGAVQVRVEHRDGSGLSATLVDHAGPLEPGTDVDLLARGHPTLTALESVRARPDLLADLRATPV